MSGTQNDLIRAAFRLGYELGENGCSFNDALETLIHDVHHITTLPFCSTDRRDFIRMRVNTTRPTKRAK